MFNSKKKERKAFKERNGLPEKKFNKGQKYKEIIYNKKRKNILKERKKERKKEFIKGKEKKMNKWLIRKI